MGDNEGTLESEEEGMNDRGRESVVVVRVSGGLLNT